MKRCVAVFAVLSVIFLGISPASALVPAPTEQPLPTSPIVISAYSANGSGLDFVQLYNSSDELVSLDGMQLNYTLKNDVSSGTAVVMSGLLEPNRHILLSSMSSPLAEYAAFTFAPMGVAVKSLTVSSPTFAPVTLPKDLKIDSVIYGRSRTTTGYSTAAAALDSPLSGDLYADSLYDLPGSPNLEIVEVLARAKTCSPFDESATCSDFIKLKMPTGFDLASLTEYRVRAGGDESVTNTFSLANASAHGEYLLLRLRDDGDFMSLTNSGGYVWLEDAYGIDRYEDTLIEYADAGSETYVDRSWAFDDMTGVWRWAVPSPIGPNTFPVIVEQPVVDTLGDCPAGKYRNPETNRCRSLEEAVNALAACEEGKERNPVTNRCRSVATVASQAPTPCDEGQERNPATNRCRSVLSATATLTPCAAGYERNLATNRCRKSLVATPLASLASALESGGGGSTLTNALLITTGLGAVGYGFYEWRSELGRALRRMVAFVSGK